MTVAVKQYNVKVDSKKRITLRTASYDYYFVVEYDDGRIVLEPRELVAPFQVSENTLNMMDTAMTNLKEGKKSAPVDLSDFEV